MLWYILDNIAKINEVVLMKLQRADAKYKTLSIPEAKLKNDNIRKAWINVTVGNVKVKKVLRELSAKDDAIFLELINNGE